VINQVIGKKLALILGIKKRSRSPRRCSRYAEAWHAWIHYTAWLDEIWQFRKTTLALEIKPLHKLDGISLKPP
jgi:hypothetical protein